MTINGVDLRTLNKPQLFTMAMKYWRSNVEYSRRALKEYETLRAEIPEHALKKGDKFVIAREEVIKQIQTCMRTSKTEKEVEEILGYDSNSIRRWINRKWLKSIFAHGKEIIAVEWLIDFMCTHGFEIAKKSEIHTDLLDKYFIQSKDK